MSRWIITLCATLNCLLPSLSGAVSVTHITGPEALTLMKSGNARFMSGNALHPRLDFARLQDTASQGQRPFVTVLTASDSRVPVEAVFDQGIGDIYAIRVAGNVVGSHEAGSIEYGISHLQTPLLVILGHTHCGAVAAVAENATMGGNIGPLMEKIVPAVERAGLRYPKLTGSELLPHAIEENVNQSITDLLSISEHAVHLVESGKLMIVGGIYKVEDGSVRWLGQHPQVRMIEQRGIQKREEARALAEAEAAKASRLPPRRVQPPKAADSSAH